MIKGSTLEGMGLFSSPKTPKNQEVKVARKVKNESVKVIVVYSGKGGVGKTTTTANMAMTLLSQGYKVAVIDGDVNTPSMGVVFKKDSPVDGLLVCTMGYTPSVFVQTSKIREFFRKSTDDVIAFAPDYLLIDTPPSITDVHIGLLETFKPSGLVLVTQPTALSMEDVSRTVWVFAQRGVVILGVVRSMVTPKSPPTVTPYPIIADIKFHDSFDGAQVFEKNKKEYARLVEAVKNVEAVVLENKKRMLFEATPEDFDVEKARRFINLDTWPQIREVLMDRSDMVSNYLGRVDLFIDECTPERVMRLVEAFEYDDEAYFMVTRSPATVVKLIPGEIGRCRLKQMPGYYNIPSVEYHTKDGAVTLFPYEVTPATAAMISDTVKHDGRLLNDGRYLPGLGTVKELYACYGSRVGLHDSWPVEYLHWIDSYTPEEREFLSDITTS